MYKHIKEFGCEKTKEAKAFLKTVDPKAWIVVDYAEDVISFFECPSISDAQLLLYNFHTEGSHSDHNTYKVYHNRKQYKYKITATIY